MKSIFIFSLLFFIIYLNKSFGYENDELSITSSSGCKQYVSSISEVNPFDSNATIQIVGEFCLYNTTDVQISMTLSGSNIIYSCDNPTIDPLGQIITCTIDFGLDINQSSSFNFNEFNTVFIKTPIPVPDDSSSSTSNNNNNNNNNKTLSISPVRVLGSNTYLYTNQSCPEKCKDHGVCSFGSICLCKDGYASFDCSHKITNDALSLPIGIDYSTFGMVTRNDIFNIKLISVITSTITSSSSSSTSYQQQDITDSNTVNQNETSNGLSFSTTINEDSWLNTIKYMVNYSKNSNSTTNKLINYHGAYLPISSVSSQIVIEPTINTIYLLNNGNTLNSSFEMILQIENSNNDMDSVSWEISDSNNSILFNNKKTDSLVLFSLSDIYSFNQSVVPNHAHFRLLSNDEILTLLNHSNDASAESTYSVDSIYLSIVIQQQLNTINTTGTYQIQLVVNAYNYSTLKFPEWAIALIIVGAVASFAFVLFIVVLVIRKKRQQRNVNVNNSEEEDHHHHHGKKKDDENKPLLH
ncbi:hypothetical protein ACTA71_011697 [Dictyostelium dimigraforme]